MGDPAHRVSEACMICYHPHKPCNHFAQEVAQLLGVSLPKSASTGNADAIIASLRRQWRRLDRAEAVAAAGKGKFIIAGLASSDFTTAPILTRRDAIVASRRGFAPAVAGAAPLPEHGHVCVVIPGMQNGFPRVVSTTIGSGSYGYTSGDQPFAGHVFRLVDAEKVEYFTPKD